MGNLLWVALAIGLLIVIAILLLRIRPLRRQHLRASPDATPQIDKNVQFTVYRPATVVPGIQYSLLAFAHLSRRRPEAPKDEPDPVEEVERQATQQLKDQPAQYEPSKLDRVFAVPRKGLLTFVPSMEGCEFDPPSRSVQWLNSVEKVEFKMTASAAVDGRDVQGQMTVFLGKVLLTDVPMHIAVDSRYVVPESQTGVLEESSSEPYRKIFASYSHQDAEIVEDFEEYGEALGDEYLRDVRTLRSGEVWSERLEELIRDATVFQLFWSSNSMTSPFVRQEWEYALGLNRSKFIRPVYWEDPLPRKGNELPPAALSRIHFHHFTRDEETSVLTVNSRAVRQREEVLDLTAESISQSVGSPGPLQSQAASEERRRSGLFSPSIMKLAVFACCAVMAGSLATVFLGLRMGSKGPPISPEGTPTPLQPDIRVSTTETEFKYRENVSSYSLVVTNTSPGVIRDVVTREFLPAEVEYLDSVQPAIDNDSPGWRVAEIAVNQSITINVRVRLRRSLKRNETYTFKHRISITYIDSSGVERNYSLN
jgi:hypothetical protein